MSAMLRYLKDSGVAVLWTARNGTDIGECLWCKTWWLEFPLIKLCFRDLFFDLRKLRGLDERYRNSLIRDAQLGIGMTGAGLTYAFLSFKRMASLRSEIMNPLAFWRSERSMRECPALCRVALEKLCITGTTAAVERSFSIMRFMHDLQRVA